jgi:uncharacterized membrane protein YphA (DoxX/SURF4 family)
MRKSLLSLFALLVSVLFPCIASAHEAYVLDHTFFWNELSMPASFRSLQALNDSGDLKTFIVITVCIVTALALNFAFRRSRFGQKAGRAIEKLAPYGPLFVRAAIAAAFFFSASSMSFLGPELPLGSMPFAHILQILLYAASVCIALGLFTEIAAIVALVIFCIGFFSFGAYIFTYLNYLGEIIVLAMFGMRKWSFDALIFGAKSRFQSIKRYETVIVRICYGLSLSFAALTVKFLHPALTIQVVEQWNLTQFHWLFPHDPLLVALGAGLSELAIGLFIVFGFEMRLTVLVSLFYITLSLLYFRELVWPHLMLYGISFNLLVEPETFTLDHIFFDRKGRKKEKASH